MYTAIYFAGVLVCTISAYMILSFFGELTDLSFFKYDETDERLVYALIIGVLWEITVPITLLCLVGYFLYKALKPLFKFICHAISETRKKDGNDTYEK